MAGTVDITKGIKAIKINRTDLESANNTLSLQELEVLRINFSDKGIQEFNIVEIAEYLNYYLFYVVPKNLFTEGAPLASLFNPSSCEDGSPVGSVYTLSPIQSTGRLLDFSIPSVQSASINNTQGLLTPWIPEPVSLEIRYQVSQSTSGGPNYFTAYITGSGTSIVPKYLNSNEVFESLPGFWNSVTQSFTWYPPTPSSSIGFGFINDLFSNNALAFDFSSTLKIAATQSNFYLADNVVKDESLDAEANGVQTITAGTLLDITTWDFDGGQYYSLSRPNNVGLQTFTCSFSAYGDNASGAGNPSMSIALVSTRNGVVASSSHLVGIGGSFPAPPTGVYYLSGSYTVTGDEQLYINVSETTGNRNLKIRSGSWEVNQSLDAQTGNSTQTILEPYLVANFQYSDCNVLAGNAIEARVNDFYMDVDYSSNQIVAVNEQSILSGSATRATVQQSNYTTAGVVNSRYIGKELQSAVFNEWTDGDVSFGKTPNVSNPENYFVYFNWVGGTSPEWGNNLEDRTAANVKFIVDADGNTIKPTNDDGGINLGIVRQAFEEDKTAIVALNSDDEFGVNLGSVNGEWPIFKSGYRIEPIIYTQTASYDNNGDVVSFGYTGAIDFASGDQTPNPTISDYALLSYGVNYTTIESSSSFPVKINFGTPTIEGTSASFSANFGLFYNPTGSVGSLTTNGVTLYFDAKINIVSLSPATVTYAIQKSTDGGSNWNNVATQQFNHRSTRGGNIYYTENSATTSSLYRVAATTFSSNSTLDYIILTNAASYFRVSQSPLAGTGGSSDFWLTGSGGTQLTASNTPVIGLNNYVGQTQKNITRSGFNPITLPFIVQVGDEIRFEGTETLAYGITGTGSDSTGRIVIELDGTIPSGTNTDYFLVRRYIDDPSYVILEVNKPAGASSAGVLKPKYITSTLSSSLEEIVKELQN
jgi:hypothetical protein